MEALAVYGIIFLSVVIHEAGHLAAALATGMKVTKFYAGWGPRLFSVNIRGIETGVRLLPLGGYVKIPGMDLRKKEEAEPGTYAHSTWVRQVIVAVGGPVTHWLVAFVLLTIAFGFFQPSYSSAFVPTVHVVSSDMVSYETGFRSGDELVAFNSEPVDSWEEFVSAVLSADGVGTVVVRRSGELVSFSTSSLDAYQDLPFAPVELPSSSFGAVVSNAGSATAQLTGAMFSTLTELVGQLPGLVDSALGKAAPADDRPRSLVSVGEVAEDLSSSHGWFGILVMAAQINLFLGLFNLLPFYPLDGGHVAAALVNRVTRTNPRAQYLGLNAMVYTMPVILCAMGVLFVAAVATDIRAMIN